MKIIKSDTPRDITLHEDEYTADLEPTDIVELFQTQLTGTDNWDYKVHDNNIRKPHKLVKRHNWN